VALTMTRTRTQTTLTKLATMVANVHGELEFVQGLLAQAEAEAATAGQGKFSPEEVAALQSRKAALEEKRQALYLTLRQFDPNLIPAQVDSGGKWKRLCNTKLSGAALMRYVQDS
jgi:hypothetical protein